MKILDLYATNEIAHNSTALYMKGISRTGFWARYNHVLQNAYNCDAKLVFVTYYQGIVYGPITCFCNPY